MHVRAGVGVAAVLVGTLLPIVACGGGSAAGRPRAAAGPPPEVVRELQIPETPYHLIYTPPVSLAKRPDTTRGR
jgi:hypothetical protein